MCERCGFVPEHRCQLDVNHKNGDHSDNRPENLETLCSNCHRLVTQAQRGSGVLEANATFFADDVAYGPLLSFW
jgi:5-methylcytosine-specific restriction endonuclease McrA